ncbi:MAG: response regulator [Oscillospiraceae bacterium]|nr:response regulator [Oscillospiraceae bacterium]
MKKVLIATISEATNTALADALPHYEVHICTTGLEAIELLETLRPDILILDLMLPAMDGLTVLQKSSFRPSTILARTNLISATVLQSAAAVGVQDILLVPCTIRYIIDRLDTLTEKVPSPEV